MGRRKSRRREDGSREPLTSARPETPTEGRFKHIQRGGKVDAEALRAASSSGEVSDADRAEDEPSRGETVRFVLQRDLNKRLDRYLVDRITFLSRSGLQKLVDGGQVLVNGRVAKASTKVRKGDEVEVTVPPPPATEIRGEAMPIDVLFEDAWILVLNKRAGVIVHPARSHNSGTLLNGLVHYFESKSGADGSGGGEGGVGGGGGEGLSGVGEEFARPGVVHRLDKDTTGVMVIAKDDTAHWRLARQFEKRTTDKRYLAIVHGLVEEDVRVIDVPLGPSASRVKGAREKQAVRRDHLGKPAVTVCRVRERFASPAAAEAARLHEEAERQRELPPHLRDPELARVLESSPGTGPGGVGVASAERGFTLVELELRTGRTHQIRVHLSDAGHPIVGDDMYGGAAALRAGSLDGSLGGDEAAGVLIGRQALHAVLLGFAHPESGEARVFTAPLQADMAGVVAALRARFESGGVVTPSGSTVDLSMALSSVG